MSLHKTKITDRIGWIRENFSPDITSCALINKVRSSKRNDATDKKAKLNTYAHRDEYVLSKDRKGSEATITVYVNFQSKVYQ